MALWMAVLAPVLICAKPRIAPDVGAVLGRALDHVDGQGRHGEQAEHEHDRAQDAEEQGRVSGGEHAKSVRPALRARPSATRA
jgi:hypothetical protein